MISYTFMGLKTFFKNILKEICLIWKCKIDNYYMFLIVCSKKDGTYTVKSVFKATRIK